MSRSKARKLTPKQQRFADEYLISLNATDAYRTVYGATDRTAEVNGSKLLRNTKVAEYVAAKTQKVVDRYEVTHERIIKELAILGFSDLSEYVAWDASGVVPTSPIDKEKLRALSEITQTATPNGRAIKIKLHSKEKALELLMRHRGMLNDKLEIIDHTGRADRLRRARERKSG